MPRRSPYRIELTDEQRAALESLARSYTLPYWQVIRAQMVLLAAQGLRNDQIAQRLNCRREVVSQWRKRFCEEGLQGLEERPRPGRPPFFPPAGRPRSRRWRASCPPSRASRSRAGRPLSSPARRSSAGSSSRSRGVTIWRWLCEDAIRPWNYRSWIFPRDPNFAEKAGPILDLYEGRWEGELLQPGDFVVCADEKPSIQARARKHPSQPATPGGDGQLVEHEYERKGALCYLAAWDVRHARLFDRCAPKDGIEPFDQLVEQFMSSRALQHGPARVRDRRQRLRAPRPALDRPPPRHLAEPDPRAHPGARQLAQPGRDLLLGRAAQGAAAQQLHRPRHARAAPARRSAATTSRSPSRSSGSSPAKTSIASSTSSTPHRHPTSSPPEPIRARTSEPDHLGWSNSKTIAWTAAQGERLSRPFPPPAAGHREVRPRRLGHDVVARAGDGCTSHGQTASGGASIVIARVQNT